MNSPEVKAFIRENENLLWYIPDDKKEEISEELLVETIMNYGDMISLGKLFKIFGLQKVAEVFFDSINKSDRRKGNYYELTLNYFMLLFKKYAYEILNSSQIEFLPYLRIFNKSFFLVGGTALALQIGHRRSIDFDLFTSSPIIKYRLKAKLIQIPYEKKLIFEDYDQLHIQTQDIDYSEAVEYVTPAIPENEIKQFLIDKAIDVDFLNK